MSLTKEERIEKMPQIKVENAVLGSIMLENIQLVNVKDTINADMFTYEANSKIYKIMTGLYEDNIVIDEITVWQEVVNQQLNNSFLSEEHIRSLANGGGMFRPKNAKDYAISMSKRYGANKVPKIFQQLADDAKDKNLSIADGVAMGQSYINQLCELDTSKNNYHKLHVDDKSIFDDIKQKLSGKSCTGLSTGIYSIDKAINGLEKGRIYNFTSAPAGGKTAFACQVALHNAKQGNHVLYCSFEMGVEELSLRLVCMETGLNNWAIDDPSAYIQNELEKGRFSTKKEVLEDIKAKVVKGKKIVENLPIEIFRPENPNVFDIKTAIDKYLMQNKRLDLLVVDHLDLMHNHQNAPADLYVACKKFKDYAVNYNIPVLFLHQFNRNEITNSEDYYPSVYALKGGQAIHDNSDVIMLLWRPAIYPSLIKLKPELKNKCEVSYAKRRGGKQPEPTDLKYNGVKFLDILDIDMG